MERPDIEEIEEALENYAITDARRTPVVELRRLIAYIRHLESNQPKDGEPYVLEASEFDAEKHERQMEGEGASVVWTSADTWAMPPLFRLVVRNKVKSEPRYEVVDLGYERLRVMEAVAKALAEQANWDWSALDTEDRQEWFDAARTAIQVHNRILAEES